MFYVDTIERMAGANPINPHGVEASMRLDFGTLDHLDTGAFMTELKVARECESQEPGYLRSLAESYGYAKSFDKWEARMQKEPLRVVVCDDYDDLRDIMVGEFNNRSALAGRRVSASGVGSRREVLDMADECDLLIIDVVGTVVNLMDSGDYLLERTREIRDAINAPVVVYSSRPDVKDIFKDVDGIFGVVKGSRSESDLSLNTRKAVERIEEGQNSRE